MLYLSPCYTQDWMAGWKEAQQEMGFRASGFTIRATHEPLGGQDTEPDTFFKGSWNSDVTDEHANKSHEQHL